MARSEALKRAQDKYTNKIRTFAVRVHIERDADVIKRLESVENVTDYIRKLVRDDLMRRNSPDK